MMCLLRITRTIENPVSWVPLPQWCHGSLHNRVSSMARPLPSSPPNANHTQLPYGSTTLLSFYRMELPSRDPTYSPAACWCSLGIRIQSCYFYSITASHPSRGMKIKQSTYNGCAHMGYILYKCFYHGQSR